jgi:hypothetical protein
VDETKELRTNLILAVCQLCDETRELAQAERNDAQALSCVQDAAHLVALAIGRIRESQSTEDALPPALPVESLDDATEESWLLGDD